AVTPTANPQATLARAAIWLMLGSLKQWTVLGDHKLNGAGSGFFEYAIPWPAGLDPREVLGATFLIEASAKRCSMGKTATPPPPTTATICAAGVSRPQSKPQQLPDDQRDALPQC